MNPLLTPKTAKANELVSSIYQICVFGDGTVNERDKRLVRIGLLPSYMKAKWFHFNHLGLNRTKVENALIMLFAKSSIITLDLVFMIPSLAVGTEKIQAVNVIVDFAKLVIVPIPVLALQEYLERRFNSNMFQENAPQFHSVAKEIESIAIRKHDEDVTLSDGHLDVLKKFTALPLLNYIFFYYQMTEEYIKYRESYFERNKVNFKDEKVFINYFKTTFRMLRFYNYTEVHALNYYFSNSFNNILNFYMNIDCIRDKYTSVFYSQKQFSVIDDIKQFISILNQKIQVQQKCFRINPEICEEACNQFQYLYCPFFFPENLNHENLFNFVDSNEIKEFLKKTYDDSVLANMLYTITKSTLLRKGLDSVHQHASGPALNGSHDFFSSLYRIITNVSGPDKNQKILGSVAIISMASLIGAVIAGGIASYKYREKVISFATAAYERMCVPVLATFEAFERKFAELFSLHSVVVPSHANRVLGSVVFIISHIPGANLISPITNVIAQFSSFNPISTFIMRTATEYTSKRLHEKDIKILNLVDRTLRLGYMKDGMLTVKIRGRHDEWITDFNIDHVGKDFLVFMTYDFARVVRHQSQLIGDLFEQISMLDKEIKAFDKPQHHDFFYTGRDENGPTYTFPMCRVTAPITPELIESKAKQRFFEILIDRQNLLICLINRAYYVTLYNLFMSKIKEKCKDIFTDHLPLYMEKI